MTFDLAEAEALLARTPAVLDSWLRDLPAPWTNCDEGPQTWTPYDVVGHLIEGERSDWLPRVRHLLAHGASVAFPPFDREAQLARPRRPLGALLDEFRHLRAQSLAGLRALRLTPADLARPGRHPHFGEVSLGQHLATWVAHDLTHLTQIARVMARRYRDAVGPWQAYLRVVRDALPGLALQGTGTVTTTVHVAATPERAVAAFRHEGELRAWWKVSRALVDDRQGGTWSIVWDDWPPEGTTHAWFGRVAVTEPRRFVIGDLVHVEPKRPLFAPLQLEIAAVPEDRGAVLTVQHRGYRRGADWDWFHAVVTTGWREVLDDLAQWLAERR